MFFSAPQLKRDSLGSPHTTVRSLLLVFPVVVLAARCAHSPLTPNDLIGRWELTGPSDALGHTSPPPLRLTLFITALKADSLAGEAVAYVYLNQPLDNRTCARLVGRATDDSHVNMVIFTTDEPGADMLFDAQIRNGRMLVRTFRPRDGKNVLQPGVELTFVRQSKHPRRVGCLTRA